jgi:hypothetical protein
VYYLYRILYRYQEYSWPSDKDPALNVWCVINNRLYRTVSVVKGIRTEHSHINRIDWHFDNNGHWVGIPKYEYKLQRYQMTQEWEDFDE